MSSLHTINKPPRTASALQECLRAATSGDCLLLIEDGVYAGVDAGTAALCRDRGLRLCGLRADIEARGLAALLENGLEVVDDAGFVALCCQFEKICSWY